MRRLPSVRPERRATGLRRRLLVGAASVVASVVLLELLSFAIATGWRGSDFLTRARAERQQLIAGSSSTLPMPAGEVPAALQFYALHPYLGFVADPTSTTGPVRSSRGTMVPTSLGFFRHRRGPAPATGRPLRIGVFGGSVAFLFSLKADRLLARALRASPVARDRDVIVQSFALPGHKQPQQLFALAYLLLLGERFDVVVNIDGFNELALPVTENLPQGTAAIYPRSWSQLVAAAPSMGLVEHAAGVVSLREMRRLLAMAFAWPPLSLSPTGNLSWRIFDDALTARIGAREADLAQWSSAQGGYRASGPAPTARAAGDPFPELVELWRQSSLLMHQLCVANGIAYVHVLQPNQYLPGAKPLGDDERRVAYREDHPYRVAVERGYPLLIEAGGSLTASGVRFVDLSRIFAEVQEPLFVDDCCHFNQRGNAILANRLARELIAALPAAPSSSSSVAPGPSSATAATTH